MTHDICLLLEGTYPFVRGGVSSWIHQILTGLPALSFSLVFVGGRRADYTEPKYSLPDNVMHLESHYLEDALKDAQPHTRACAATMLEPVRSLLSYLKTPRGCPRPLIDDAVDSLLRSLEEPGGLTLDDFLFSPSSWSLIRESHLAGRADDAFLDYFWTLRLMHGPVFQLARIARQVPPARAYHSISTGFAGLLGTFLERRRQRPLLLTEHGIYTKERKIDLNQAEWIDTLRPRSQTAGDDPGASIRALWIRYFEGLGKLTYRSANPIISLYTGNRERQHQDGADPERTAVIVNGVDVARFAGALASRPNTPPHVIGLIGRLVPIKDIKTFLRAMRLVFAQLPDAQALIVGDSDEDPAYAAECVALARDLGIADRARFVGHQDVVEIFPRLGLLMLTSISEAQPLAVLEAFASGVPCVATDVGACREQIEGRTPEDRALGLAGRVVRFADADALAHAAIELLSSCDVWLRCQAAALERVRRYYTQEAMLAAYRALYQRALEA